MGKPDSKRMRSAMPQRRRCSQVRVLARLVVGNSTLPSVCSTTRQRMPRYPNSMARDKPTGPAPAMSTGTCFESITSLILHFAQLISHRAQKSISCSYTMSS